jgi:putative transcriptional regulator
MTKAGKRLIESARKARAYARGETEKGYVLHVPDVIDVKAIRMKLGMTQQQFARRFGFAYDALRDWESHRRQPERAARVLLTVIDYRPEVVEAALDRAQSAA